MSAVARQTVFLVGDQYEAFARNPHVVTASEFTRRMAGQGDGSPDLAIFGQGMRHEATVALHSEAGHLPVAIVPIQEPAPLAITHKREVHHVLISAPRKIGPQLYSMDLIVDDTMDRLTDHVTGQHIGGMLLIEASRQAAIAVTELEHLASRPDRHGFIWSGLRVEFTRFCFPLPTEIHVALEERTVGDPSRPLYVASVEMLQAGQPIARMQMDFELLKSTTIERIEAKAAARAVEASRALWDKEDEPPMSSRRYG